MKNRVAVKKILLVFIVAFSLRIGISSIPPLLPLLQAELKLEAAAASLLTSIPVICMGLFALSVPAIQKKWGHQKGISIFLGVLCFGIFLRAFVPHYSGLLVTAFMIGIAAAIIGPLLSGYIKSEFPAHQGLVIGIYSLSMGMGASISSGSANRLTAMFHGRWQFALAIFGFFVLIGWLAWQQKSSHSFTLAIKQIKLPLTNRHAWQMTFFFGIQAGIFYGMTTWISTIAYQRGATMVQAGYILMFYTLTQMIFSFVIPFLLDYFGSLKFWAVSCSLLVVLGLIGLLFKSTLFILGLAVFLIGIGLGGLFPIALLLPLKITDSGSAASAWTAMVQSFGYMIGGTIPFLMGGLTELLGSSASLGFVLLLSILLAILASIIKNRKM
jgi:CP family cyanate transporter-like MFS transporter